MSISEKKIKRIAKTVMGGIGPNFIEKQMRILNIKPFNITPEDVQELAWECKQNSTLLIGKKRADELYEELMSLV